MQTQYLSSRAWADALFVGRQLPTVDLEPRSQYQLDYSFREIHNAFGYFNPFTIAWDTRRQRPRYATICRTSSSGLASDCLESSLRIVVRGRKSCIRVTSVTGARETATSTGGACQDDVFSRTSLTTRQRSICPLTISRTARKEPTGWAYWAPRKQTLTYVQLWNFTIEQLNTSTAAQILIASRGPICRSTTLPSASSRGPTLRRTAGMQQRWTVRTVPGRGRLEVRGTCTSIPVGGACPTPSTILCKPNSTNASNGFRFGVNFTWSKLIDDCPATGAGW
jgi:hypothetical protein